MSNGNKESGKLPFKPLGESLRHLREVRSESLVEVSGAVEIDVEMLAAYESGKDRPSEDILLLLLSHFGTKDDKATELWSLAGYGQELLNETHMVNDIKSDAQPVIMNMPTNGPILYTDMVHVMANNYGVVMNFMQGTGPNSQPIAVARIGMSKEHAKSIIEVLQRTLLQSEPKTLPEPIQKKANKKKS